MTDPRGLAEYPGVYMKAENADRGGAGIGQPIVCREYNPRIFPNVDISRPQEIEVVELPLIRNGEDQRLRDVGMRGVVTRPVEHEFDAGGREQLQGARGLARLRAHPTGGRQSENLAIGSDRSFDHG